MYDQSLGTSGLLESSIKPKWQMPIRDRSEEVHSSAGRQEKGLRNPAWERREEP